MEFQKLKKRKQNFSLALQDTFLVLMIFLERCKLCCVCREIAYDLEALVQRTKKLAQTTTINHELWS